MHNIIPRISFFFSFGVKCDLELFYDIHPMVQTFGVCVCVATIYMSFHIQLVRNQSYAFIHCILRLAFFMTLFLTLNADCFPVVSRAVWIRLVPFAL